MSALYRHGHEQQPAVTDEEAATLTHLLASPDLMGMARILEPERAAALRGRAERMLSSRELPPCGEF